MKKKILLVVLAILAIMIIFGINSLGRSVNETYEKLDNVTIVDVSDVADGVYEGIAETALVKVTVKVTVEDHQITSLELLRHDNGKGRPAESMLEQMLKGNTSEVDEVSGATLSSKTIKAAVRDALSKGAIN